jgi:hypothetical protein
MCAKSTACCLLTLCFSKRFLTFAFVAITFIFSPGIAPMVALVAAATLAAVAGMAPVVEVGRAMHRAASHSTCRASIAATDS